MTVAYDDLRAAGVPVRRACALIGRARGHPLPTPHTARSRPCQAA
jgi:hypothetical protein